jgi:hypothetical protein
MSQLQSIQGVAASLAVLSHLQPFTALTSLRLEGVSSMNQADKALACAALESLVSLRCLEINALTDPDLLPCTSSLTNLTSLSALALTPNEGVPNLRYLPPQLQELTMTMRLTREDQPVIDLSHVTGLTRLTAVRRTGWLGDWALYEVGWAAREAATQLPPLVSRRRHVSTAAVGAATP